MQVASVFLFFLISVLPQVAAAPSGAAADQHLQRGKEAFRAGRWNDAIDELKAASDSYTSPETTQNYVNSGVFAQLDRFETAMVYMALSYDHLGKEKEARDSVLRIATAERIDSRFTKLPLDPEVAEFPALAQRLAPDLGLPQNMSLQGVTADQLIAAARSEAQREAQEKVDTARAADERAVEERIAAERAAILKAADEKIAADRAAIEREADARVAAARAEAEKEAQQRIDAARSEGERQVADRVAAERAAEQRSAAAAAAAAPPEMQRLDASQLLRQGDADASIGDADSAAASYARVLDLPGVSRDALVSAAVGLYRAGDFVHAVDAFGKVGTFHRGEEDLRYYNAVSLYETGHYDEAKKELACALPFIQIDDEVTRYRSKIESMAGTQASK